MGSRGKCLFVRKDKKPTMFQPSIKSKLRLMQHLRCLGVAAEEQMVIFRLFSPCVCRTYCNSLYSQAITDERCDILLSSYVILFQRETCKICTTPTARRTPATLLGDGIFLCCQSHICKCDRNVPTGHEEQWESSTH